MWFITVWPKPIDISLFNAVNCAYDSLIVEIVQTWNECKLSFDSKTLFFSDIKNLV